MAHDVADHDVTNHEPSRRQFVKKAVYLAPVILSLAMVPSYAKAGSEKDKGKDKNEHKNKDRKAK